MLWLLLYPLVGLVVFPVLFHLELKRESVKGLGHATALFGATIVLWPIFVVLVPHAQRRDLPAKGNEPLRVLEPEKELNFFKEAPSRNGYPEAPKPEPTPVVSKGVEVRPTKPKFATGGHVKMMVPNTPLDWYMPPTVTELDEFRVSPGTAAVRRKRLERSSKVEDFRLQDMVAPFAWEQVISDDWHIEETIDDRRICDTFDVDDIEFRARLVKDYSRMAYKATTPKPNDKFSL